MSNSCPTSCSAWLCPPVGVWDTAALSMAAVFATEGITEKGKAQRATCFRKANIVSRNL